MKVRVVLFIIFLVVFGIQATSYGLTVGVQADPWLPNTEATTQIIDTTDITFYVQPTKDFTNRFAVVDLAVSGGALLASSSIRLNAADTEFGSVEVTVPRTALTTVGTHTFTVTASSTTWNNIQSGTLDLTVEVTNVGMLAAKNGPIQNTLTSDTEDIVFTLQVKNTGTAEDTITLSKTGLISDLTTLSRTEVTLAADATEEVTLTIPRYAILLVDSYSVTVQATSQNDATQRAEVATITHVELDIADVMVLTVIGSPTQLTSTADTGDLTFTLRAVEYYASTLVGFPPHLIELFAETWDIELTVTGDIDTATLDTTDFKLGPNATQDITLTIPRSALTRAGRYAVTVTASPSAENFFVGSTPDGDPPDKPIRVTVIVTIADSDRPTAKVAYYENLPATSIPISSEEEKALKLAAPSLERLVDYNSDPRGLAVFKISFGESVSSDTDNPNDQSFPISKLTLEDMQDATGRSIPLHGIRIESVEGIIGDASAYQVVLSIPKLHFPRLPITILMGVEQDTVFDDEDIGNIESYFVLNIVKSFTEEIELLSHAVTLKEVGSLSQISTPDDTKDITWTLHVTNNGNALDTINLEVSGDVSNAALDLTTIELDPDLTQEITLTVPRSALTEQRTYNVKVEAVSESDPTQTAELTFQAIITEDPDSVVIPPTKSLPTTQSVIFSEFMFEAGGGDALPQWIELYNNSSTSVNLRGWKLHWQWSQDPPVEKTITFKQDFIIPSQQCRIIVTAFGEHSNSGKLSNRDVYPLHVLHAAELLQILQELVQNVIADRIQLISRDGFSLKLTNTEETLIDHIGTRNEAGEVWELPPSLIDNVRCSMIRRFDKKIPRTGTERRGWIPANVVKRLVAGIYYGHRTDLGTPGYRRGKPLPLPVELSQFTARLVADEIVISWTTESELDNAGFNIFRSTSRTKNFKRINAKLVQGAGTTGQRTQYQFIDETAKPNVAYYYRLEDVDLSGTRDILVTYQLRGVIAPTGKRITTWGTLKGDRYLNTSDSRSTLSRR